MDLMDTDASHPTRETVSRVLQISTRTLWIKPPDLSRVGDAERAFFVFPPAVIKPGGFFLHNTGR